MDKSDIGYIGVAPATVAVINQTAKVVVLAQVNTEGSAIIVGKNAPINKVADLKGKKIGIPGRSTVQDFLLGKAIRQANLYPEDLNIVVVKPTKMIESLQNGKIDGFVAWAPYPSYAISRGVGKMLITSAKIWPNHPCCVLAMDLSYFNRNPEIAVSVVKAHIKATTFINNNKEEAIQIGVKYTGMDEESVKAAMGHVKYVYEPTIVGELEYIRLLLKMGYIRKIDPKRFIEGFINTEPLRKAKNR